MKNGNLKAILIGSKGVPKWINSDWSQITPAPESGTIPAGDYVGHLAAKQLGNAGTGTPTAKLTFVISEGNYAGRRLWYDIWLTQANRANAVRDFAKLGIEGEEQIETPLPTDKRLRCQLEVSVRRNDSGQKYSEVRTFAVIGIDSAEVAAVPASSGKEVK